MQWFEPADLLFTFAPDDDWSIQSKHQQVIFQAQVGHQLELGKL